MGISDLYGVEPLYMNYHEGNATIRGFYTEFREAVNDLREDERTIGGSFARHMYEQKLVTRIVESKEGNAHQSAGSSLP